MRTARVTTFKAWRDQARVLLQTHVSPTDILWSAETQTALALEEAPSAASPAVSLAISKEFLNLAQTCACFRDEHRWDLLYQAAWRLLHGETNLLHYSSDPLVHRLRLMEKAVRRDIHKMHAFVRFREIETVQGKAYVAWHRPDHFILERSAPFFVRRFGAMCWTLLTPDASASWDQGRLTFGPGVDASQAPKDDPLEAAWKAYYASIFNPARVKIKMMKQEMPVRHWATLPEASLIPTLLRDAPGRLATMQKLQPASAAAFVPLNASWDDLRSAASGCIACDLCQTATQTVFGEGPVDATVVLLGEQPGDEEDLQGRPFIGPAGQLLDRALVVAGLNRDELYITNAVKHFRFVRRGKRRLHQKPSGNHLRACRPWLKAEMELIRPQTLVCLGVTSAQTVLGRAVTLKECRGQTFSSPWAARVLVTYHPSAILRMEPDLVEQAFAEFAADLRRVYR